VIYLEREKVEFTRTKQVFEDAYAALLEKMYDTFKEKGRTRDIGTPIHHRMSPAEMLGIAQAKGRRADSLLSVEGWELSSKHLASLVEESVDAANYLLYIAALCRMLQKEAKK
jgi:hypothetical protein